MSLEQFLQLSCLIEGEGHEGVFDVQISPTWNVRNLKDLIHDKGLASTAYLAKRLTLFKVNIDPASCTEDFLKELKPAGGGDFQSMSATQSVSFYWSSQPARNMIDVFVKLPAPVTINPSSSNEYGISLSNSQKRSRSPTVDDGRVAKRQEIEEVWESPNKLERIEFQTRCAATYEAIGALPDDLNLSNPSTFTTLPFPSLIPMLSERFERLKINDINHFQYMGRFKFRELQQCVAEPDFLDRRKNLYLYGTSGSGKSHLLGALVIDLIRNGDRVFYIPDCSALLSEPEETMWAALNFAYFNSPTFRTVEIPKDIKKIMKMIKNDRDIFIVIDQTNTLKITANHDGANNAKIEASGWLRAWRYNHRYVFSASASETSNRDVDKSTTISHFKLLGGMSTAETDQWFIHHGSQIPQLSIAERQLVERLTGCIPLLLRCLFGLKTFDEFEFRRCPTLTRVQSDVDSFFLKKYPSFSLLEQQKYLDIMWDCITGDTVLVDDRSMYDLRYFYVDGDLIGHSTCGVALETMLSRLRHQNSSNRG